MRKDTIRKLLILATLLAILITMFTLFVHYSRKDKAQIIISAFPDDTEVLLGGKNMGNKSSLFTEPGTYVVTFQREGFTSSSQDITVNKGEKKYLSVNLIPESGIGYTYLEENQKESTAIEVEGNKRYSTAADNIMVNYPLVSRLPKTIQTGGSFSTINYSAQGEPNNPTVVILIAYTDEAVKMEALQWIANQGYSIDDYKTEFKEVSLH